MENANKSNREQGQPTSGSPNPGNDQNQVVNEQDQNRPVNTGDEDYKENVTGRTQEKPPRDLNLSGTYEKNTSDAEGGAEIETPHKHESDDEESTERKIPKM